MRMLGEGGLFMRITGGAARGRRLKAARGSPTRPSSDLVRGAIFSMLGAMNGAGTKVLDLFAGTGALGIEALSRGAHWVDFVDSNARACGAIRDNLSDLGLGDSASVHCMSAVMAIESLGNGYTLAFLDPPYGSQDLPGILQDMAEASLLRDGALVVIEHSKRDPLEDSYPGYTRVKDRAYGETHVSIYLKEASA